MHKIQEQRINNGRTVTKNDEYYEQSVRERNIGRYTTNYNSIMIVYDVRVSHI